MRMGSRMNKHNPSIPISRILEKRGAEIEAHNVKQA